MTYCHVPICVVTFVSRADETDAYYRPGFLNLSKPNTAHFVCIPYPTRIQLIQLISSLVETARPEVGVSDKGDIQNVQW